MVAAVGGRARPWSWTRGEEEVGLYPVRGGRVLEEAAVASCPAGSSRRCRAALAGPPRVRPGRLAVARRLAAQPEGPRVVRRRVAGTTTALAAAVRAALPAALRRPAGGW